MAPRDFIVGESRKKQMLAPESRESLVGVFFVFNLVSLTLTEKFLKFG